MAYDEVLHRISLDADSSIATFTGVPGLQGSAAPNQGFQYRFVKVTGIHKAGLATAAANEVPVGVLQSKPQVVGQASTVALSGVSKVEAGTAGITAGLGVKVETTTGKGVVWTAGTDDADLRVGVALSTAASGQLASVLLLLQH